MFHAFQRQLLRITIYACLISGTAYAQGASPWQLFEPWGNNSLSASSGVDPLAPNLRALFFNSITPSIGTTVTYTRSGTFLSAYLSGTGALVQVATDVPPIPYYPQGPNAVTSAMGGIMITSGVTNYLLRASEFDNAAWTKIGSASVVANSARDPLGVFTGDTLSGAASGDAVEQSTGQVAASKDYECMVWLKTLSGTTSVDLTVRDQAGSPASTTATYTVSSTWKPYTVNKLFAGGATGNAVCKITFNVPSNTLYAFGAAGYGVSAAASATQDLKWNPSETPTIITTTAPASVGEGILYYSGTELTASSNKKTVCHWFYTPTYNVANVYQNKNIMVLTKAAGVATLRALLLSATGFYNVYYDNTIGPISTGVTPTQNRWNHMCIAADGAGSNETILNGASINTNAGTFSAYALVNAIVGQDKNSTPTTTDTSQMIHGGIEVFTNKRLTLSEATQIYNNQKSNYGL